MIQEFDGIAKTTLYHGDNKYLPGDIILAVNYFPNYLQLSRKGDVETLSDPKEFDSSEIDSVNIADAEEFFDFTHPRSYDLLIKAESDRGEDDARAGMIKELQKMRLKASR